MAGEKRIFSSMPLAGFVPGYSHGYSWDRHSNELTVSVFLPKETSKKADGM